MPTDRWGQTIVAVRSRWRALERDWQSVAVGAAIVALTIALEVHIPW